MNATCPDCRTVYRVDPAKVPAGGVRARCIRCPGEFDVSRDDATVPAAPPLPATGVLEAVATSYVSGDSAAGFGSREDVSDHRRTDQDDRLEVSGRSGSSEMSGRVSGNAEVDGDLDAVEPGEPPLPPPPFGTTDPSVRAKRLARALVSDMLVYNSERRERSLRDGTLRQEFRDEIRKSWEEYVSQVGNEIARETSYFQEALNEILAGGARQF